MFFFIYFDRKGKNEFANRVDPDEAAHNELPHLNLPCLPSSLCTYEPVSVKTELNDIDTKIEITTSLESIGLSICFLKI